MDKLFNFSSRWVLVSIVIIAGLFGPYLMGNDANEYAAIALKMHQDNDYVNIINRDYDYLDKPHLLFWSAAWGYKIFGIHDWSYRLLSVLVCLAGAYATFRLGKLLYHDAVGKVASLMFISSQAIQLGNHDVRTDALLTGFVIISVWQFVEFVNNEKLKNILLGAAALALAVGTKGMVAVLVVGSCLFFYILSQRKWQVLLNWKWIAGVLAFFIALSPILYCYYLQFDSHPEKLVDGRYGVSGIKFLLWTQSFDRFAADHPRGANSPEFVFFYHSFLWSFLPWTLIALSAFFVRLKGFFKTGVRALFDQEQLTFLGIFVMFNIMSLSQFKLPHYINVLFPMIAIATASFLVEKCQEGDLAWKKYFRISQIVIVVILFIGSFLFNGWFFPLQQLWLILPGLIFVILIFYAFKRSETSYDLFWTPSLIAILMVNFFLNLNFYPELAKYQAGSTMVDTINKKQIEWDRVYIYDRIYRSFDFYGHRINPQLHDDSLRSKVLAGEKFYVLVNEAGKKKIEKQGIAFVVQSKTPDMNITKMTIKFLNPATRESNLKYAYLLEIN